MIPAKGEPERPTPVWRKLLAAAAFLAVVACVVLFWDRIGPDFLPPDASRVGPNLLANVIQWAVIFVVVVLLWPPWRRRLHRFVDRKLAPLHAKVDALQDRHDEHAEHLGRLSRSLTDLHEKIDQLSEGKGDD